MNQIDECSYKIDILMNCLTHVKEGIHKTDHPVQCRFIVFPYSLIECANDLIITKREIDAGRCFASFVVVHYSLEFFLTGISIGGIDDLDESHQNFRVRQAVAVAVVVFSRIHSLLEGL